MNMHHGRIAPALVAGSIGAAFAALYLARYGLDADLRTSAGALTLVLATFVMPGIAAAAFAAMRSDRRAITARVYAPMPAIEPARAVVPPFPAAEAAADIVSLTEERVGRQQRERRTGTRSATRDVTAIAG